MFIYCTYHDTLEQLDSNDQMQDIQELMDRLIYIPMSKKRQRVLYQKNVA